MSDQSDEEMVFDEKQHASPPSSPTPRLVAEPVADSSTKREKKKSLILAPEKPRKTHESVCTVAKKDVRVVEGLSPKVRAFVLSINCEEKKLDDSLEKEVFVCWGDYCEPIGRTKPQLEKLFPQANLNFSKNSARVTFNGAPREVVRFDALHEFSDFMLKDLAAKKKSSLNDASKKKFLEEFRALDPEYVNLVAAADHVEPPKRPAEDSMNGEKRGKLELLDDDMGSSDYDRFVVPESPAPRFFNDPQTLGMPDMDTLKGFWPFVPEKERVVFLDAWKRVIIQGVQHYTPSLAK